MIRTRIHYWTCSKFADWVRGEKKPYALELHKWEEWRKEQEIKRPIRFWLSDTFLAHLQNFIFYPSDVYHSIKYYIKNRFITKTHYLKTGLKPGYWYDFDERILHGIFNELVDFVEIELAHLSKWDKTKKYYFKNGRCVEAAYDYFNWAKELEHEGEKTRQAENAQKIQDLYEWWKTERSKRINSYDYDLEEKYQEEDTKMLIKLIEIRNSFWT